MKYLMILTVRVCPLLTAVPAMADQAATTDGEGHR
jgi:hypothetical protein